MLGVIVWLIVAFITYAWVVRGFFSALVHLFCTVVAGAIAFGVWESLGHWLLSSAPDRGVLSFLRDAPWAIALAVPFALALGVLRFATNKLLPANARCDDALDYVGGGVCGLAAASITAGIFLLSIGFLRFGPDAMGYQPVRYTVSADGRGSIERESGFLVGLTPRFDLLTAKLYERLSLTSLRSGEPLGKWHPQFDAVPWANRMTYQGRGRNTVRRSDFDVQGWYTVGREPTDTTWAGQPLAGLMTDQWDESRQSALGLDGKKIDRGYIAGFKARLKSGAKEKQGQIIVGAGQVRLAVESVEGGEHRSLFPVAVVTNVGLEGLAPDVQRGSARFRFNGNDVFFASVGGAADAGMWFEFAVPSGFRPIGLYVKNARWEVPDAPPPQNFPTAAARDQAIEDLGGQMFDPNAAGPTTEVGTGVEVSNALGWRIQRGSQGGLEIQREGRFTYVVDGEETFRANVLRENARGLDQILLIDRFQISTDTVIVKIDVSLNQPASLLSPAVDAADPRAPLILEDVSGGRYECVGFVYSDEENVRFRYTVGKPIQGLEELTRSRVTLSRSRPQQRLQLIFRPTLGIQVRAFKIGNTLIAEWEPPIDANTLQR